jgi:hypothetical protein
VSLEYRTIECLAAELPQDLGPTLHISENYLGLHYASVECIFEMTSIQIFSKPIRLFFQAILPAKIKNRSDRKPQKMPYLC